MKLEKINEFLLKTKIKLSIFLEKQIEIEKKNAENKKTTKRNKWGQLAAIIAASLFFVLLTNAAMLKVMEDSFSFQGPSATRVSMFVSLILLGLYILYVSGGKHKGKVFDFKITRRDFGLVLITAISMIAINLIVNFISFNFFGVASKSSELDLNWSTLFALIIFPIFMAPIAEEFAFRYSFKKSLIEDSKWGPVGYVVISSSIFAFFHFDFNLEHIGSLTIILSIGILSSILFLKTNKLIASIMAHLLYNATLTIVVLM